jgi:response regulator RpfG family c-di-GMP phosphodiesterase
MVDVSWKQNPPGTRYEIVFVMVTILAIAVITLFIDQKVTLLNFYFLPVIMAGTMLGAKRSILCALFCIFLVSLLVIFNPEGFDLPHSVDHIYTHIVAWSGFLILSGAVVGKQGEKLQSEVNQTKEIYNQLAESNQSFEEARAATILGLAKLAEYRDNETGAHIERMREYVRLLAMELSNHPKYQSYITNNYINDLYESSILHDIGKVAVPDKILRKPGKLTMLEFEVIKTHTTLGGDALKTVETKVKGQSFLTIAKEIAYYHHEKWDGSGYPKGLKGTEIPLSARITALADFFDALTSKRVYKGAMTQDQAKALIVEGRGRHFDPDVVDAFLAKAKAFADVRKKIVDAD